MEDFNIQYYVGIIVLLLGTLWISILKQKNVKYKIPKEHHDKRSFRMAIIIIITGAVIAILS